DGEVRALDAARKLTIDVAPGAGHSIAVDYPAGTPVTETFHLYFEFEKPFESGWSPTPTNATYASYLRNAPNPQDNEFLHPTTTPPEHGVTGDGNQLREWLRNRLADPKEVTLTGHASFENDRTQSKRQYNLRLSQRRLDVAVGIIADLATIQARTARGQ